MQSCLGLVEHVVPSRYIGHYSWAGESGIVEQESITVMIPKANVFPHVSKMLIKEVPPTTEGGLANRSHGGTKVNDVYLNTWAWLATHVYMAQHLIWQNEILANDTEIVIFTVDVSTSFTVSLPKIFLSLCKSFVLIRKNLLMHPNNSHLHLGRLEAGPSSFASSRGEPLSAQHRGVRPGHLAPQRLVCLWQIKKKIW